MELVRIEPGSYRMGQLQSRVRTEVLPLLDGEGRFDALRQSDLDEKPLHRVEITKAVLY